VLEQNIEGEKFGKAGDLLVNLFGLILSAIAEPCDAAERKR